MVSRSCCIWNCFVHRGVGDLKHLIWCSLNLMKIRVAAFTPLLWHASETFEIGTCPIWLLLHCSEIKNIPCLIWKLNSISFVQIPLLEFLSLQNVWIRQLSLLGPQYSISTSGSRSRSWELVIWLPSNYVCNYFQCIYFHVRTTIWRFSVFIMGVTPLLIVFISCYYFYCAKLFFFLF